MTFIQKSFYCNNTSAGLIACRTCTYLDAHVRQNVQPVAIFFIYLNSANLITDLKLHPNCLKVFHLGHLLCSFHVSIERRDVLPLVRRTSRNMNCTERSCKITVSKKS